MGLSGTMGLEGARDWMGCMEPVLGVKGVSAGGGGGGMSVDIVAHSLGRSSRGLRQFKGIDQIHNTCKGWSRLAGLDSIQVATLRRSYGVAEGLTSSKVAK
jgi:hypothetical protein